MVRIEVPNHQDFLLNKLDNGPAIQLASDTIEGYFSSKTLAIAASNLSCISFDRRPNS